MPLRGFISLLEDADHRRPAVSVAAAGAADRTVLQSLRLASERGWIQPIVIGDAHDIASEADASGVDLGDFEVIHAPPGREAEAAVAEVREGRAEILLKGMVGSPELVAAILDPERGLRSGRALGQVVLMEVPRDRRRFLMADTGVMARPKLAKKAALIRESAAIARALGAETPRVALMAASEKIVESLPETLDATELTRQWALGEFPGMVVAGPLSFDLAYAPEAAGRKGIGGDVAGAADVMIFPDLASANLTVKAIMYTAECRFGGVLCGTTHPVAFMSRADDVPTRLNSLALAIKLLEAKEIGRRSQSDV